MTGTKITSLEDSASSSGLRPSRTPDTPEDNQSSGTTGLALNSAGRLVEVVQTLSMARSLEEILAIVCAAARELTGADGASFVLRDGGACLYADEGAIAPMRKGRYFPLDACIGGWVMENHTSVAIPDVFVDPRISIDDCQPTFARSLAMVPIRAHSTLGAIGNYWSEHHHASAEELKLLQTLADSTAVVMENIRTQRELEDRVRQKTEELEAANEALRTEAEQRKQMEAKIRRLSLTDELTGVSNHRGFLMRAELMLKLVHRVRTHGWLIYIDLDGLKQVNNRLGHEAGDQLIRNAAKVLRESFRDSDVIGRIGGDEFVVFATGPSTPAEEIEHRLRQNIAHFNACFPDQSELSMSIGVTRCDPYATHTLDDMIHQADAAMYIEKRRRRSRTLDEADG